jgi:hypothetical protein
VTRQISMTTRKELVAALQLRYRSAAFGDRIRILDEFVALTGYPAARQRGHASATGCTTRRYARR